MPSKRRDPWHKVGRPKGKPVSLWQPGEEFEIISEEEVIECIRKKVKELGSIVAFADSAQISPTNVSDILRRTRPPTAAVINFLGIRKIVAYQRTRERLD